MRRGLIVALLLIGCTKRGPTEGPSAPASEHQSTASSTIGVARLKRLADKLLASKFVETGWGRDFVQAARALPEIAPRTISGPGVPTLTMTEDLYYNPPKYGDPLAYLRPLEQLARVAAGAEPRSLAGLRIFDFGYGGVGHLRMLASLGAHTVGVDVDPMLPLFYAQPGDQGPIGTGSIKLVNGRYPAEPAAVAAVGSGFDLVISKNVLKRGYIHPTEPVDPRMTIKLGVDDRGFLTALSGLLKPGGWLIIYNICPAPSPPGTPFKPWSDGHSPFSREAYQQVGLEVLAFDQDDTAAARAMGRLLEWDLGEEKMDLEHDLFATYTLLRKAR